MYSGDDPTKKTSAGFLRERHVVDIIPEYQARRDERRGYQQREALVLISSSGRRGDATPRAIHVAPLSACPYVRNTFAYSILSSFRSHVFPPHLSLGGKTARAYANEEREVARGFYFTFESCTFFRIGIKTIDRRVLIETRRRKHLSNYSFHV